MTDKGITDKGIRFSVYDRARWREFGSGTRGVFISRIDKNGARLTDEQLLERKAEAMAEQKRENENDKEENGQPTMKQAARRAPLEKPLAGAALTMQHAGDITLTLDGSTGNTVALLAASKAGKSTLMMRLYDKYWSGKDWISSLFTISGQARVYRGHPGLIKVCGFPPEGERLIKLEKLINTKGRKPNKYKFCNLLDDIIDAKHSKLLNALLLVYRNSNMTTCLSLQYPYLMSKPTRANINFALLGRFHSEELCGEVVRMFLRSWLSMNGVQGLENQINWYKRVTEHNGFVLINNLTGETSLVRLAR